ncbi:hypothetical protein E6O75_ATG05326 [Venturia nashicola]|uniref:Uncharacterized protein n=1 Tax=Venturia nashicola TaxID=86259 RepID=A0A4Z1PF23_9PEZI|nr:hypothetical protein E6O75_ATG05326 [Venturia nashicola]
MDDLDRLFPGAKWTPYSGYIASSAMLLQRAFKAYEVGDVNAFMKVLDGTEARYLHEHAHGRLASLDKLRWALEDKAASVQEDGTAYGDQWQIEDLPTNEHMSAHERYCDNFWLALKQRG